MMVKNAVKEDLLKKVVEQEHKAEEFGFRWQDIDQLIQQIKNETEEVKEAFKNKNRDHLQEEVGDLLQAAISLAVFCKLDPSSTLKKSIAKFQMRYDKLVHLVKKDGLTHLKEQSNHVLLNYWEQAKKFQRS